MKQRYDNSTTSSTSEGGEITGPRRSTIDFSMGNAGKLFHLSNVFSAGSGGK